MKVIIIALDGLEPSLVTQPELLQDYHGIVDNSGIPLQTPVLWASFLTGSTEHGIGGMKSSNRFTNTIARVIGIRWSSRILKWFGLYNPVLYAKKDLRLPTIFGLVDKYIAVSIPSYNEPEIYLDIRRNTVNYFDNKYSKEDLMEQSWNLFYKEYLEFKDLMCSSDWELAMIHFFVTDIIGHLGVGLEDMYRKISAQIANLCKSDEWFILILSDHGMKRGLHTREGFWSCSHDLEKRKIHITDFYKIIEVKINE